MKQTGAELLTNQDETSPDRESLSVGKRIGLLVGFIGEDKSAELVGKSVRQLKRYAEGAEPPFKVLRRLSEAGDVSFEWIVHGKAITVADIALQIEELRDELHEVDSLIRQGLDEPPGQLADLHEMRKLLLDSIAMNTRRLELKQRSAHSKGDQSDPLSQMIDDLVGPTSRRFATSSLAIDPAAGSGGFLANSIRSDEEEALYGGGNPGEVSGLQQDFVVLPLYEVQASAGNGIIPVDEQISDSPIAFGRPFLRALGARPDACILLPSKGDSMLPTIPDGSLMVVDRSQTEIDHGCIYVFTVGHSVLVKRARWRMDGKLELVSDNGAAGYPIEIFGPDRVDELSPVGRVVYFCRIP